MYNTTTLTYKCALLNKSIIVLIVLLGFVLPLSTTLTNIVLCLLLVTGWLEGNIKKKITFTLRHPISRAALLFFGIFVVGVLYAAVPLKDSLHMLGKMSKLLYLPFLLSLIQVEKCRRLVMSAFIVAMVLTFLVDAFNAYKNYAFFNDGFIFLSTFKDPIYTNLMMAFASFVLAHYIMQPKAMMVRIGLCCLLIIFMFYLFMSTGRTGQVIFAILWLLFCVQRLSVKGMGIGSVILLLLLAGTFVSAKPFQSRALQALQDIEHYQAGDVNTSVGERLTFFKHTWRLAKQRLWFGFGTGSFKELYRKQAIADNQTLITSNPHNEYLNILLQLGVLGLLAFLGFLLVIFKNSLMLPKPEQWFAQGILAAMAAGCFANSWLMDFTSGYFFIIITAVCFSTLKNTKEDKKCLL